ncbi:hypothetical protein ACFWAT_13940 [Streptomyces syringium]|uniref:hypothetical protein n=1 Tax=Streptomyces syringium TaxID=76729 RepID=UPI00366090B9
MTPLKRAAAVFAAGILLTVGSAALAAPAHADAHVNILGIIGADTNGTIDLTGPGGAPILVVPNLLQPVV